MDFSWGEADRARYRQARALGATLGVDVAQREAGAVFCTESWRAAADSGLLGCCLLYTSPSPRDRYGSRMPSSA